MRRSSRLGPGQALAGGRDAAGLALVVARFVARDLSGETKSASDLHLCKWAILGLNQ